MKQPTSSIALDTL